MAEAMIPLRNLSIVITAAGIVLVAAYSALKALYDLVVLAF